MNDGILVIGSLNMDIVIEMQRMPRCGETVLGKSLSYVPGGKGANQACAAGKLCKNTTMLGCVGEDLFGEALIENLKNSGVCVDYLKQTKKNPTGTAIINVDEQGNNNIVVVSGANENCDVEYLRKHDFLFQQHEYVVFQLENPYDAIF